MRRTFAFVSCAAVLFATGCLHPKIGPQAIPRDRALYSVSLADSWKSQTLLNIVKVRYIDPPVFVDVGNIVTSYTLSQGATAGAFLEPSGVSSASLGGSVVFSNTPTITYTPLTGNAYIKGLATPLAPTMVFTAIQNGLPADSVLLSSVVSINGLKNQEATLDGINIADPNFNRVRELMRKIQDAGAIKMYVKQDGNKQQGSVLVFRTANVPPAIEDATRELRQLLHLSPTATEFTLVQAPVSSHDTEIAILTRSILGLMLNMASQVEVPPEDIAQHRAYPGCEAGRTLPGVISLTRIQSSKKKPDDSFVSIFYRNTWFWIDDRDLTSKRAFAQLMQLFTMADTSTRENLPVVTIPAR